MPTAAYMPTASDDAARQQTAARAFYLLGDFLAGSDTQPRIEPGSVNNSGLLGPSSSPTDIGIGVGGEVFVRGQAGQVGATQTASTAQSSAAVQVSPLMLVAVLALIVVATMHH